MAGASGLHEPTVGVRYVGPLAQKKDNLLGRKGRVWRRGEVLQVPVSDARAYLKHPRVWAEESAAWDERGPIRCASDGDLLAWLRAGDADALERAGAGDLAHLVREVKGMAESGPRANTPPTLAADDAENLTKFVPALARALTLGPERVVREQVEAVAPLLLHFPPLLAGMDAAEREGQGRKAVLGLFADLLHQMDGAHGISDGPQPDLLARAA